MKKFYLLFTAMLALFVTTAKADRILFSENYEAGGVPATWTRNGSATTLTIVGDTEGKYISFYLPQENGRSAHCLWGESIFDPVKEGLTEYSVSIDFQFQAFGSNQFNGEIAVFSGETCPKTNGAASGNWDNFSAVTPNCLFSLSQNSATEGDDTDHTHWYINGDATNVITPAAGTWYNLTLTVNTATREVSYEFADFDNTLSKKGSKVLAEDANIYASGLYLMNARYQSVTNVDNIKVTVPGDYANEPVIALTGLNMAERTYTISFLEGETLHVTLPDGTEKTVGYNDCEPQGAYTVTTTTSGTIKAYTTVGNLTSTTAEVQVVCEAIVLNGVVSYKVVAAEEGFAKTYQFTIDNSGIEMQPEIFMDFEFKSDDGQHDFTLNNQNSGANVSVGSKGTLTVTAKALGYERGVTTIVNNIEYVAKYEFDFQHMTAEQLTEKGFVKIDDLNTVSMSGENSWTGRMRMRYGIATGEKDADGNDIVNLYPVYGFTSAAENYDATVEGYKKENGWTLDGRTYASLETAEPIERYFYASSKMTEESAHSLFAPLYTWSTATGDGTDVAGLKVNLGIGIINAGAKGDETGAGGTNYANGTCGFDGLTDDDLVVVSMINNYGGGSYVPTFPAGTDAASAKTQYKAMHLGNVNSTLKGTETFNMYRIDTAINRILVLTAKNGTGIEELPYNKVVSDHNAPIYNLNGVRVDGALKKGIYIKQGKKFIVQ